MPEPLATRPNLALLAAELCGREYADRARAEVLAYARDLGCLEGCPYVDPDDRAALDAILETCWPAVRQTSSDWDEDPWKEAHEQPTWTVERRDRIAALWESHGVTVDAGDDPMPPEFDADEPYVPDEEDETWYAAWSDAPPSATLDLEPFHP